MALKSSSLLLPCEFFDSRLKSGHLNFHIASRAIVAWANSNDALLDTVSLVQDALLTDVSLSIIVDTSNLATATSTWSQCICFLSDGGSSYIHDRLECLFA
jgi:hypothetical protein